MSAKSLRPSFIGLSNQVLEMLSKSEKVIFIACLRQQIDRDVARAVIKGTVAHRQEVLTFRRMAETPRRQCAKCPWKKQTDPTEIPNYIHKKHKGLTSTIADPGSLQNIDGFKMMACHETQPPKQLPCVGWLLNQLGPGNNILLRLAVTYDRVDGNVEAIGPQHERFEDTLPKTKRKRR